MQVQSEVYFRVVYGVKAQTVAHRMRTWYRQQIKKHDANKDHVGVKRLSQLERDITIVIGNLKKGGQ